MKLLRIVGKTYDKTINIKSKLNENTAVKGFSISKSYELIPPFKGSHCIVEN